MVDHFEHMRGILFAEDDVDIRELLTLALEFSGFTVYQVENGIEAVEAALRGRFDLIILDVRMPRMTGYEACRRLKEIESTKNIPVMFLSAKGQEAEMQHGLEAGAVEYLLKPVAGDNLVRTIKRILENKRLGVY